MKRWLLLMVLVLIGLALLYGLFESNWSYSTGERAGWIQKFSRKGWLCKTWEGEMAMVSMPGTLAEKFSFTVPDEAIAVKLNATLGKRVSVHYEQHKWIPSSCFGDTDYFVTGVQVTE